VIHAVTYWFDDLSTRHFSLHILSFVDEGQPLESSDSEAEAAFLKPNALSLKEFFISKGIGQNERFMR